ncbi:MAG: DNA adenine methylase [Candidatus Muirbacterium halophilum]|nr:DNA adenine methylase [Candidatus Muirbacterium halophilum]
MKSIIKYYGGKNGMAKKIIEYFPNDYQSMNYVEPFCGSAALLFHKDKSPIEVINDLDKNIYSIFKVLIDPELFNIFKEKCDKTLYMEDIRKEYMIDLKNNDMDIVDRAYKYFYVNRTSYNGIGGFSSSPSIRRNMSKSVSDYLSTIDGLYDIHDRLSKVIIHNTDALKLIEKWDKPDTFMYLDSPYFHDTRTEARYKHDMSNEQQYEYLNLLISLKNAKVLVSGYKCDAYELLERNGFTRIDMEINTQNTKREPKTKIESLWFNY